VDVEFLHDVMPVFFNRFGADAQVAGDLFIGLAFGNQPEHLRLPRSQASDAALGHSQPITRFRVMTVELPGDGGTEEGVAVRNFPDRLGQQVGRGMFDQVSRHAQRGHLLDAGFIAVRREDENLRSGVGFEDLPDGFHPIEHRHRHVHDHDRRPEFSGQLHRLSPRRGLPDHLEIVFGLQQSPQALPHDRMVVRKHDGDSFHNPLPTRGQPRFTSRPRLPGHALGP
jgi:hypothetical protein